MAVAVATIGVPGGVEHEEKVVRCSLTVSIFVYSPRLVSLVSSASGLVHTAEVQRHVRTVRSRHGCPHSCGHGVELRMRISGMCHLVQCCSVIDSEPRGGGEVVYE